MLKGRSVILAKLTQEEQDVLRDFYTRDLLNSMLVKAGVDGVKLSKYHYDQNELKGWIYQILAKLQTDVSHLHRENQRLQRQLLRTTELLTLRFENEKENSAKTQ
jgi:hypothetical protein